MLRIVIADQWDRGNDMFGRGFVHNPPQQEWNQIAKNDRAREAETLRLLQSGALKSGKDFGYAALVFQHSADANGILLAHVLSIVAVSRGDKNGLWLAAASLDRYLIDMKQPQVFGTQFLEGTATQPPTMDPYNRAALTDAERALLNVPSLKQQQATLASMSAAHHR